MFVYACAVSINLSPPPSPPKISFSLYAPANSAAYRSHFGSGHFSSSATISDRIPRDTGQKLLSKNSTISRYIMLDERSG